jgi:hypothetical protein
LHIGLTSLVDPQSSSRNFGVEKRKRHKIKKQYLLILGLAPFGSLSSKLYFEKRKAIPTNSSELELTYSFSFYS